MQDNDKLIKLIERAASSVNMLSPDDMSEINQLQLIFTQINKDADEMTDVSAELVERIKKLAADVNILNSVESASKSVSELQNLISQVYNSSEISAPDKNENSSSPDSYLQADDVPLVLDFIAESNEHIESAEAGLLELETNPDNKDVLNQIFRAFHTIKGMAGFLNLNEIGSLAHSAENLLDLARKHELELTGKTTDVIFESIDMMKKMADDLKISAEKGQAIGRQSKLPQLLEKLKASAKPQEADAAPALPEKLAVEEETPTVQNEITQENDKSAKASVCANIDSSGANTADEKIKVSTARLDDLINMAGELVIAQLMVGEEAAQSSTSQYELNRKIAHQGKIVRRLQELSMSMRMVPIAGVFQKMTRLVRDLAQKSGKQVNLITFGEETELDRNVVDKISDPLVHMIRNSADHGIEFPQDRKNAGKDVIGQIKLRAFHQAGNIVIQIEDDGKGLDKERIRKKAIDAGLIGADQSLTDDQIYRLIFHAGLSTAEKITAVSGRGVGMDVVKKNIELLRGKIDIASTYGKGTIFTIRLPLTLATIDGQVVRVGQNRYLIPINSIVATFRPKAEQLSSVNGRGELVMVRGQLLPLIRMNKLFNIDQVDYDPTESLLIIVEDDGKRCSLLVDDLLSQQQVVIKSLGDGLGKVKGVSGSAIMGNGMVSLILDIPGIMKLSQI